MEQRAKWKRLTFQGNLGGKKETEAEDSWVLKKEEGDESGKVDGSRSSIQLGSSTKFSIGAEPGKGSTKYA